MQSCAHDGVFNGINVDVFTEIGKKLSFTDVSRFAQAGKYPNQLAEHFYLFAMKILCSGATLEERKSELLTLYKEYSYNFTFLRDVFINFDKIKKERFLNGKCCVYFDVNSFMPKFINVALGIKGEIKEYQLGCCASDIVGITLVQNSSNSIGDFPRDSYIEHLKTASLDFFKKRAWFKMC